jgi:hypothetical protein
MLEFNLHARDVSPLPVDPPGGNPAFRETYGGFPAWDAESVRDEDGGNGDDEQVYEWGSPYGGRGGSEELVDYLCAAFDHQ